MNKKIFSAIICICLVFGNVGLYAQSYTQTNACEDKGEMVIALKI